MSLLSPYIETQTHGPNFEEPPLDLVEEQLGWEVQEILDSQRFRHKKLLQYQVQWKGYSQAHNSWEPANNIFAPDLVKEYYQNKGVSAIKKITPITPSRINTMTTTPSAALSTPSYIQEITTQFQQNPLPDFALLNAPNSFKLNTTYQADDPDSLEIPMPPPISLSPLTHESLIECMEHNVLHKQELMDWPGEGWELTVEASHSCSPMLNDQTTNTLHKAKWVKFVIDKDSGQPMMWGCNRQGKDIVAQQLVAAPCYTNISLRVDDTDLAPFTDVNMLNPQQEQTLWELNDYGVLADIFRLCQEPIV